MSAHLLKRQVTIFAYLAVTAMVLIGADVTYFGTVGENSVDETSPSSAGTVPQAAAQCKLDTTKDPVANKGASLLGFGDITKGNPDAEVTVIEYFDPNCPHCKDFHRVMKKLVDAYKEEVQFIFKPFPLRASSLPEIQALYVAHRSDKFAEMLEAQYRRQGQGGINQSDLRSIAKEIGMDPQVVINRIDQNKYRKQVVQMRKRAIEIGVTSTPTVLVNGHFVESRSLKCMKSFIDRAKAGTLGSTSSE